MVRGLFSKWLRSRCALGVILSGLSLAAAPGYAADADWKPSKPVEVVVGVGVGGGTDLYARLIQKILQEQRLTPTPLNVANKSGGGGAIGMNYLAQRPADGHTISVGNATLVTTHIIGRSPLGLADVTPIAMLAQEYVGFAVKTDSPIRTGKDLLARLMEDPASVSIAIGAAVGNQNHIAIALAAKSAGVDARKLKTVIFKSGGETITSILGGHVDIGLTSSSAFVNYVQAGTLRLIAIAAPQRLGGALASVPTWKELGVDSVAGNWFAVFGPKGMPAAPVRYWEGALASMAKTDEWRKFARAQEVSPVILGAEETARFLMAENDKLRSVLVELGLVR